MIKKVQKSDLVFTGVLLLGLAFHLMCIWVVNTPTDETFYITIPLRLVSGESLIQHEWHLSQFSSLFSYLPVFLWTKINDSADGIVLFMRCAYLLFHTLTAVFIYVFFRKYKYASILASLLFYTQLSYRLYAISYNSMFALFILLLAFCLLSIRENKSTRLYILTGVCYGCCCVCNPLFCLLFLFYLIICIFNERIEAFVKKNTETKSKQKAKSKNKSRKNNAETPAETEFYSYYFDRKALIFIVCGISVIAVTSIAFFLFTGGTFSSVFRNLGNLLSSSEYQIGAASAFSKILATFRAFNSISFKMPFLLPLFFIVLFSDKKRKECSHKITYLILSVAFSIMYLLGITFKGGNNAYIFSLPFAIFSVVCYILTENKNKPLFFCLWCTGIVGAVFNYFASNTQLSSAGVILSISNVAGSVFACDLFREMLPGLKKNIKLQQKNLLAAGRTAICIGFLIQALLFAVIIPYGQIPTKDYIRISSGPFAGMLTQQQNYEDYQKFVDDINEIKGRSGENDPVLIDSYRNWLYLHIDRPFSIYTTWKNSNLQSDVLIAYYKENPDRIPKYIYVDYEENHNNSSVRILNKMFDYTREKLSNGILLTVKNVKFEV